MSNIRLKTEIPGPNARALMARRLQALPRGVYASTPLFVRHAEGAILEDVDGNRFIDLGGGIGCANVGHRNPRVLSALRSQLDAFLHLCFQVTGYESYVSLAEKLNQLTPGSFAKKTFFVNSGAEAVENAVKIARAFTGRSAVLCVEDGFHGRTMTGLSLTSKTHPYKEGFGPFLPDVYRIPYGVPASARLSNRGPMTKGQVNELLDQTFRRVVAAESVAAIVIEPVLGEGGFVVPPAGFLPALVEICRERRIVFVADEVQTGFGRTGELFASKHFGIEPDLILTAKSLGGGLPLGAITGRAEIMDAPGPGGLGGTFGGNPASCAAALAVLEEFADGTLLARARSLGRTISNPSGRMAAAACFHCRRPRCRRHAGDGICRLHRSAHCESGEETCAPLPPPRRPGTERRDLRQHRPPADAPDHNRRRVQPGAGGSGRRLKRRSSGARGINRCKVDI